MSKPERAFDPAEIRFGHSDGLDRKPVFMHDGRKGTIETFTALKGPDVITRLYKRGTITPGQFDAAESWATDYERAGMGVAVCSSYGGAVAASSEAEPERRRAAKERFRKAYDAMTGRGASLAWGVIIDNHELKHWPQSTAYVSERLREALDELADFYGC